MSLIITVNISTCLLIYQKFSSNYIINRSEIAVVTCTEIPQCDVNKNSSYLSYIYIHTSFNTSEHCYHYMQALWMHIQCCKITSKLIWFSFIEQLNCFKDNVT